MIWLPNGRCIDVVCGAGAFAFDGRGWLWEYPLRWLGLMHPDEITVVTKTLTGHPVKGNYCWYEPWRCARLLSGGNMVNAIALTNDGLSTWIKRDYPIIQRMTPSVALSLHAVDLIELTEMLEKVERLSLSYIELSLGCPNTHATMQTDHIRNVLHALDISTHVFVAKLTYDLAISRAILKVIENCSRICAIHAINAMPWTRIYSGESPLWRTLGVSGSVSGPIIRPYAIEAGKMIRRYTKLPWIGGGGIDSVQAAKEFRQAGASACSIGSVIVRHPIRFGRIVRQIRKEAVFSDNVPAAS